MEVSHDDNETIDNKNSSFYENSNKDENNTDDSNKSIVSNFSETDIASEENDISNIQRPEIVTKVFPFECAYATINELKKETFYDSKNGNVLPYRIFIPKNYDTSKQYSVILFLHGAGERGTDNEKQLGNIRNMFQYNGDLIAQSIIICPQTNEWWDLDRESKGDKKGSLGSVLHLLDEIQTRYSCDKNRIYVTGLSMGGYGTWSLLEEYGDIFAAGMPICGWGDETKADVLKEIPIRIYHSRDDTTVSFAGSMEMYQAIVRAGGGKVKFIELDGLGHNSWDYAYSDREAFCWLLAQNKVNNPTCEYEYIPCFRVVDETGKIIISDEDIDAIYNGNSGENKYVSIELVLNFKGLNKLKESYKNNQEKEFTVYWSFEKLYTFKASGLPIDNSFFITDVFTRETYLDFSNTLLEAIF